MQNAMISMLPGGYVGSQILQNEEQWLWQIRSRNPGLFTAFKDRGSSVFRCWWHGEFPGKLLTGVAQTYRLTRREETFRLGTFFANQLAAYQEPDGYLGPWPKEERFDGTVCKWDTWGHYHCILGLYEWYQVSGDEKALETACRAANLIYSYFFTGTHHLTDQSWGECNFAVSHALILLYEETGLERYLRAAEKTITEEWKIPYHDYYTDRMICCDWLDSALKGKTFYESNQPRWEGLHTIMTLAGLYRATGKACYRDGMRKIWQGIRKTDIHNFGGFGSGEGALGRPYYGGSETCNTVAWMAFTTEYLNLFQDPAGADELERSFYNATLGSVQDHVYFSYMNAMTGERDRAWDVLSNHSYEGARDMSCCQANGNRGLTMIASWAVLAEGNTIFLNYLGAFEGTFQAGGLFHMKNETDYPRGGSLRFTVETEHPLTLKLRIPGWCKGALVNGQPVETGYVELPCEQGRTDIQVVLPLNLRREIGREECAGKETLFYGPVLLAKKKEQQIALTEDCSFQPCGTGLLDGELVCGDQRFPLRAYADAWSPGEAYDTWI